nr:uncharacterized protein K02A2.6-like [Haemonchus contortus]
METQFNRRHGALRRKFEHNDTVYTKDYRGSKQSWTPGVIVRRVGNTTYLVRCGNLLWTRHVNQLRPRSDTTTTTTTNTLLDVFDLPLFDCVNKDRAPRTTATDPPRRSQRNRRPQRRLQLDPKRSRYDTT